ncbi:hypothetical protein [Psychrobacter sp. Marseille-P5312]|uniref:hypothetical protein n=1 Tax=Psychrobacter sp. Marseille-P5312 TaxID=2086574 RepID=UPI000CF714DA|nr:hypothetical protein [Psychrobacter sp. Marseille-P5312]
MIEEMHFANVSTRAKLIKKEWAAAVAEYLEEVGATDLDDPNAPKRKTPRTDAQLRELEGIERKKADERAQAEYKAAMERLNNGTAVLRQPKERTPVVVTKPKGKELAKKPTKPRKARAKKPTKVVLTKNYHQLREAAVNNRIKSMLKMLNAGGKIEMLVSTDRKNHALYCLQRKDIVRLRERASEDLIRVKNITSGKSYFVLDRYPRYSADTPINILEPKALLRALTSGKLVRVDSIKQNLSHVYKHITELVKSYGFNIHSIHADNKQVIGWILLEDESKEAAYKEFEAIAAGIGATVKQVIAAGNGQ